MINTTMFLSPSPQTVHSDGGRTSTSSHLDYFCLHSSNVFIKSLRNHLNAFFSYQDFVNNETRPMDPALYTGQHFHSVPKQADKGKKSISFGNYFLGQNDDLLEQWFNFLASLLDN